MSRFRGKLMAGAASVMLVGSLAACTSEAEMEQAEEANVPTEDLVGQSMTITHDIQEILPDGVFTVGDEDIIVMTDEVPEELNPGDRVEITGTVEKHDVYDEGDFEALQDATDEETARDLVERGEDLVIASAAVKPLE